MPNPIWPLDLPQDILADYNESFQEHRIEASVDIGRPRRRPILSAVSRYYEGVQMLMTREQLDLFEEFYLENVQFDWVDPRDGETEKTCEFFGPRGAKQEPGTDLFEVTFSFEVLP